MLHELQSGLFGAYVCLMGAIDSETFGMSLEAGSQWIDPQNLGALCRCDAS